ncbi:hypothetical protein VTI74DRAFT_421 [Chaetomium olivicolor]
MGDIADFLLDTALKVGESVLKVAAPEINKAIDASSDLISKHALDLAKALDLSGAFIPGNPLAFAPALQLAKALTSVIPGPDQKEVIDTIERLEKQVAPFTQRADDVLQQLDAVIKTGERLEEETHEKVHQASISAYQALEDAVSGLVTIPRGTARIQRADAGIMNMVDLAVERFRYLHKVSETNAWKLGNDAAALISFADSTKAFKNTLQEERQKLKRQLRDHDEARARHKDQLKTLKTQEDVLEERRRKAVRKLEAWWNEIAFVIIPSSEKNLKAVISDAEEGIRKNKSSQRAVDNQIRGLYLLDTLIKWAMRALDVVMETVARVAQDFQAKFERITTAQQISDRLFAGLLEIANKIQDTDFRTTRDNSLRVVLAVLRLYHELRMDRRALDIPGIEERRIHRTICERLGEDGVKQLMLPPAPVVDDDDDVVNSM